MLPIFCLTATSTLYSKFVHLALRHNLLYINHAYCLYRLYCITPLTFTFVVRSDGNGWSKLESIYRNVDRNLLGFWLHDNRFHSLLLTRSISFPAGSVSPTLSARSTLLVEILYTVSFRIHCKTSVNQIIIFKKTLL